MSHPFPSQQDASILGGALTDDERLAAQTTARLLITAPTSPLVQAVARRVHMLSDRAGFPFVETCAGALPLDPPALRATCSALLESAAAGSVLLCNVEEMPWSAQGALTELLSELAHARTPPSAAVRLVSGTTVSLFERVVAGTFSDRLFYRLNIIHLVAVGGDPRVGMA